MNDCGENHFHNNVAAVESGGGFVDADWLADGCASGGADCAGARIVRARGGLPNLEFELPDGKKIHAHSQVDPRREARRAFEGGAAWAGRHAVVYGLGCGYHIEAIAEAVGESGAVTVFECNPAAARAALEGADFTRIARLPGVRLLIGPGEKTVPAVLSRVRELEASAPRPVTRLYVHNPSLSALPPGDRLARAALCFLREGFYLKKVEKDPRSLRAFEEVRKRMLSGGPLTDMDIALLFVEATRSEDRFYYFDAPYEPAEMPERASSVLLISLSNIGDVVAASAVFGGLRGKYPTARIVFLTEQPGQALYERCALIDRVIGYPRAAFLMEFRKQPVWENLEAACARFIELLEELRRENFDTVINLHPSARSALIAGALDVPLAGRDIRIPPISSRIGYGFGRDGMPAVSGNIWFLARLLEKMPTAMVPEENHLRVLGLAPGERKVNVCVPESDGPGPWVWRPMLEHPARGRSVGINPFASTPYRSWGNDKFLELGRMLINDMDLDLIVFAGPDEDEKKGAHSLCYDLGPRATPCIGAPPDQAAWAARQCRLFITNDTGPMHFAAAAGARCLVISGPTNSLPYSALGHISIAADLSCSGCGPFPTCEDRKCFKLIEPSQAAQVASAMLEPGPRGAFADLHGTIGDGKFPHRLSTTGTYESLTPRFLLRLRDTQPVETNIVAEWTRIAVLNAMLLIEAGTLESRRHPLGTDHPGLAAPFAPETAFREVLRRHDFIEPDAATLKQNLDFVLDYLSSPPAAAATEKNRLFLPFDALALFLAVASLPQLLPPATAACSGFIAEIRKLLNPG